VSKARQLDDGLMALDQALADDHGHGIGAVRYSLASGVLAVTVGAAVSLAATGSARIIVWCAAAGITSVAAGLLRRLDAF
jgi:hypothetical protein